MVSSAMEISKPATVLLNALKTAANGRAKIRIDTIHAAFLSAFPQWQGSADRRERLAALLDELATAKHVRLPNDRRRAWEQVPSPALPRWLTIVREVPDIRQAFDYRSFPWVPELAFAASLRAIGNPDELRRIHEFLKGTPQRRPIVPVKERSFQLFGDEKRLDALRKTTLFASGRITLDLLRCRDVPASLPSVPAPEPSTGRWLIVENEAAFHSFVRLNALRSVHSGVVLGSGRNVLRGVDFLAELATPSVPKDFLYFGDVDRDGVEIPALLDRRLQARLGQNVYPAEQYYDWLLTAAAITDDMPVADIRCSAVDWFPPMMRRRIRAALSKGAPIVQEAVGWEFLCEKLSIPTTDDDF